jgi:hypothetical protein
MLVGCGGASSSAVVEGSIQLDGQPLSGAQIQLVPRGNPQLAAHAGTTDAQGKFSIRPESSNDRPLEPGLYAIVISKYGHKTGADAMTMVNVVPAPYGDSTKTPLTVDVKAGVNQVPPIELKSKKTP